MRIYSQTRHLLLCFTLATLVSLQGCGGATVDRGNQKPDETTRVHTPPRLVVVLVFDQLRADYLQTFQSRFLPAKGADGTLGGFRFLGDGGAWFPVVEHNVLQAMTAPGHANISTGAYPSRHGIPMNKWYDPAQKRIVLAVEDAGTTCVGPCGDKTKGRSPHFLRASTIGDTLKNTREASKVVAISLKDRAAILTGGWRANAAIWFDKKTAQWVTSSHYAPDGRLPDWVNELNKAMAARKGESLEWTPTGPGTGLTLDTKPTGFSHSVVFGHPHTNGFPVGIDLTVQAAKRAIAHEKLGGDEHPDILFVSFSTTDIVGHCYGPNSREVEEIIVAADRAVSNLLNHIKNTVPGGLEETVIAITGDHGVASTPTYVNARGIPATRIDGPALIRHINRALDKRFRTRSQPWIASIAYGNLFFDDSVLKRTGVSNRNAEQAVQEILGQLDYVVNTISESDVQLGRLTPGWSQQIQNSYVPHRSGDVIMISRPFDVPKRDPAHHWTGYNYDQQVPLLLHGAPIRPGIYGQFTEIIDIAPTLSFLLGIVHPSAATGRVLHHAVKPDVIYRQTPSRSHPSTRLQSP